MDEGGIGINVRGDLQLLLTVPSRAGDELSVDDGTRVDGGIVPNNQGMGMIRAMNNVPGGGIRFGSLGQCSQYLGGSDGQRVIGVECQIKFHLRVTRFED